MAAGGLALLSMVPYIASVLQGKTRPSRISWAIWTLLALVLLVSYEGSGASDTIWLPVAHFFVSLTIFILSLKFGVGGSSLFDWLCASGAALAIATWLTLDSAPIALFICIAVDALGAIPTLRKSYQEPFSEDLRGWSIAAAASALNLAVVADWSPHISLYPIYSFALTTVVSTTLYCRRKSAEIARAELALPR